MRRLGLRFLMVSVGLSLLVVYLLGAVVTYWALAIFWVYRPPLVGTLLLIGGFALVFGYLSYQFGTARILSSLDATEITRAEAPQLYRRVEELAAPMSIHPPQLLVAEMSLPNALSLGGARNGVVVVDRSLFRLLSHRELSAILAHEFAHLERRDSLVQTLAFSVLRTITGFVTVALLPVLLFLTGLARAGAWIRGRPTNWTDSLLGQFRLLVQHGVVVVFFLVTLVIRAHSRRREFAADDRAAEVTGDPVALARALSKIERINDPNWGLLSPLYTSGDEDGTLGRILSTHPATEDRIERLLERARSVR